MTDEVRSLLIEGTRLLQLGKTGEALELLKEAHRLEPTNIDVSLNLSGAYILTGAFKKAIPVLEELVDSNQVNAAVYTNLGAAYLGNPVLARNEEQRKAIKAFKQALNYDPAAPNAAYNIGLIYRDRKEYSKAEKWFTRALEHNPSDRDAARLLARLREARN